MVTKKTSNKTSNKETRKSDNYSNKNARIKKKPAALPDAPVPKVLVQKEKREVIDGREITLSRQRKYFIADARSGFSTQFGAISGAELMHNSAGIVRNTAGKEFFIFPAGFIDKYKHIRRLPQTIPLKDIGIIVAETGIGPDSVVLESGTGSAGVTCFLARHVKRVITYELRQDFAEAARKTIDSLGIKNVDLKNRDFYTQCDEKENAFDLVVLDLPEPWKAVEIAERCVKPGGFIVSYSPNISQTIDLVNEFRKRAVLIHVKTVEILEREWEIDLRKVRPKNKSMIHSGYLSFARKISE